jgi:ABC-2 type transport system ATP-binding protein
MEAEENMINVEGAANENPLLKVTGLSHRYGTFQALHPLNLNLYPGEIAVLEGPNGSGKSTLLSCLSGLMRPTTGEIQVNGHDLYSEEIQAKRALAFVPDVPRYYIELTAWEHLRFIALAHGAGEGFDQRAERLMKDYGLWDARDLFPHYYSRGMNLKLGILLALIRPFKVLLLDEPTSALDTQSVENLFQRLKDLSSEGASILLSTHMPHLKETLADRCYFLVDGNLQVG